MDGRPVSALVELALAGVDLAKAELRIARAEALRAGGALVLLAVAGGLLLIALALGLAALFLLFWRAGGIPPTGSCALTGLVALVLAGIILGFAKAKG